MGKILKYICDLTDKEIDQICYQYHDCTSEGKVTCPLWYGCRCLRGFIQTLRYIGKNKVEVEVE